MPTPRTEVVDALQAAVRLHLLAVDVYSGIAGHIEQWGYPRLADRYRDDADEKRGHLAACVARLEVFNVAPAYDHKLPAWPRHDYAGILTASMSLERQVADAGRQGVLTCRNAGDEQSALVFAKLLDGSEDAIAKIEAAHVVISEIGLDNYLSTFV